MKKKSITVWAFENGVSGSYDINYIIEKLSVTGFQALELSFAEHGTISFDTDIIKLKNDYTKWLKKGIEFSSISTLLLYNINMLSNDVAESKYALKIILKMIEIASELNIKTVSIVSGLVISNCSYHELLQRMVEIIKIAGNYAKEREVYLCIENVKNSILVSPGDFKIFLDKVDNEYVAICLDIGNAMLVGPPRYWFEILDSKIKKIHFTDIKMRRNLFAEYVMPGTGEVDWKSFSAYESFMESEYMTIEIFFDKVKKNNIWLQECCEQLKKIEDMQGD